jgi:hypothetical protein
MGKASVTVYVIAGLLVIIVLGLYLQGSFEKDTTVNPQELSSFQKYFDDCALYAIIQSNVLYGFVEGHAEYQGSVNEKVNSCMQPYLESLEKRAYTVKKGTPSSSFDVFDKTIVVTIMYPVVITKENFKFSFDTFTKTFEREKEIDLDQEMKQSVASTDGLARIDFSDKTGLYDIYGKKATDIMIVKVSDKREKEGGELKGNLIYCLLPFEYMPDKPTKICLYASDLLPSDTDHAKLKISWLDPRSKDWGFLKTEIKNGCLQATINYTTCFGLIEKDGEFGELAPGASTEETEFFNSLISAPPPDYQIYPGYYDDVFNKIREEMGGPYDLDLNPVCVPPGTNAYCYVGSYGGCNTKIHCLPDKIISMTDDQEKNMLFRHEITHSIQQVNDAQNHECGPRPLAKREWGAEYYSGSNYYSFTLKETGNTAYTARQLVEYLKSRPGCTATDEDFQKAAFCESGSYENLNALGCMTGKGNTDIAETITP